MSPEGDREGDPGDIPEEIAAEAADVPREARRRGRRDRRGAHGALPRGGRRSPATSSAAALKNAVVSDELFPVACGSATKNLGTTGLLDLLVEGIPSPAKKQLALDVERRRRRRVRLQDGRRPVRRPDQRLPRPLGRDHRRLEPREPAHEAARSASAQLLVLQGKEHATAPTLRRRRHRRRREAEGRR